MRRGLYEADLARVRRLGRAMLNLAGALPTADPGVRAARASDHRRALRPTKCRPTGLRPEDHKEMRLGESHSGTR